MHAWIPANLPGGSPSDCHSGGPDEVAARVAATLAGKTCGIQDRNMASAMAAGERLQIGDWQHCRIRLQQCGRAIAVPMPATDGCGHSPHRMHVPCLNKQNLRRAAKLESLRTKMDVLTSRSRPYCQFSLSSFLRLALLMLRFETEIAPEDSLALNEES